MQNNGWQLVFIVGMLVMIGMSVAYCSRVQTECEKRGGVLVRGVVGYECVTNGR